MKVELLYSTMEELKAHKNEFEDQKEYLRQYHKLYTIMFPDYGKEYCKEYYKNNKDTLLLNLKQKTTCECCGRLINRYYLERHKQKDICKRGIPKIKKLK